MGVRVCFCFQASVFVCLALASGWLLRPQSHLSSSQFSLPRQLYLVPYLCLEKNALTTSLMSMYLYYVYHIACMKL